MGNGKVMVIDGDQCEARGWLWNGVDGMSQATLILAHGAGAPMNSEFMQGMAERLAARGVSVLRFEFPERPGALFNFLNRLGGRWNITMFHYRNHGAADGRVLAALQVPEEERQQIPQALDAIGYPYWDETDNPAYKLFLG